jgi:cytochrome c peroxidase
VPALFTRRTFRLIGLVILSGCVVLSLIVARQKVGRHPDARALTEQRIVLGRQLFNDPHLSADGTIRCASCHIPEKDYTDGRRVAVGVGGRVGTRNTPSLMTIGTSHETSFFWDGRRSTLNQAVLDPLTNPVEMGLSDQTELVQRIQQSTAYVRAFAQAFPETGQPVTPSDVAAALVAYVQSLRPQESAYDRYALKGDQTALSPRALLGLAIFKGKARCAECHLLQGSPAVLTDNAFHRTGVGLDAIAPDLPQLTEAVIQRSLQGADIGNRVATYAEEAQLGRFNVTLDPADIGLFRTPSLRNVSHTAPYMHDGSVPTLDEAIDREVYYRSLQAGRPLPLTVEERLNLKAFLETL